MKEERGHSEVSAAADVYLCVCVRVCQGQQPLF